MEEGLDTGPVIQNESTNINDTDNLETLTNRLSNISSNLLINVLERIKKTKAVNLKERLKQLNAIEQSNLKGSVSYARQIEKEDFLIDWNQNASKIRKKIQGLYPNAYTFYNGKRIKLIEVSLLDNTDPNPINHITDIESKDECVPGQIIMLNKKKGITIMTKDYPVLLTQGQFEGKNKTDGYTLSTQSNIKVNSILGN